MTDDAVRKAPANSLPSWSECQLRVENSDYIAQRVAGGGYGPDGDEQLASELHRFIYEYDDADPYRSAWFLHRLERMLTEAKTAAFAAGRQAGLEEKHVIALQNRDWEHQHGDDRMIACHSRVIGGVLCRWWGDVEPVGVQQIDKWLRTEAQQGDAPQ